MKTSPLTLDIRERQPDELPLEVEIYNASLPSEWHETVEEVQLREQLDRPEDQIVRLLACIEGEAVGAGTVAHRERYAPGRFSLALAVRPQYRRRGIGRALYQRLLAEARDRDANKLECWVIETELWRVTGWLAREEFRETERRRPSELQLPTFDPAAHADTEARALAAGITFTTLADQDTEENRRKLWMLSNLIERDIPFDSPRPETPFAVFCRALDSPQCLLDCLVIARHGDEYVGFSTLARRNSERAMTWTTGVHPDYRNRGIATALKVRSATLAREQGFTSMRTFNHVNNPAMLAVNTRLGYAPLPELISFVKPLAD